MRHRLDLFREVLDHELVDADGVACGIVDDLELANSPEGPTVAALLVGPGAWLARLPALIAGPGQRLFGRAIVRVPWEEVERVAETIELKSTASELGLGRLDRKAGLWLAKLPKS